MWKGRKVAEQEGLDQRDNTDRSSVWGMNGATMRRLEWSNRSGFNKCKWTLISEEDLKHLKHNCANKQAEVQILKVKVALMTR